jgi:hypothetical protein
VSACAVLAKLAGTGDSARLVAVGGACEILARIDEFVRVGVSKFLLGRPRPEAKPMTVRNRE